MDDKFEGALGYRCLGQFCDIAPWPDGSRRKALQFYRKAVAAEPGPLHARYYLGKLHLHRGDLELAKNEFTFVAENPAHPSEAHFIDAYKAEARKHLMRIVLEKSRVSKLEDFKEKSDPDCRLTRSGK